MKRTTSILSLALLSAIVFAGFGLLPGPAGAANQFYADCISCHAMPVAQAEGLDRHSFSPQPPPGLIQDLCFECHEMTDPGGHPSAPPMPYYWWAPLGFSGSTVTRMCTGCHPPYDPVTDHPNDVIPFDTNTLGMPGPTSVLPLYDFGGLKDQDPAFGGISCATCHDPHDPSYTILGTGRPGYLRIGDGSGDTAALCSYCHTELGPPTTGYDLFIGSDPLDVTFSKPAPGWVDIQVTVRNRGNAAYPGGWMEVQFDDGLGGPFPIDSVSVPPIAPDSSDWVWVGIPDLYFGTGEEVFHFVLEPSQLNPVRNNTFVRAPYVPPTPQNLRVDNVACDSVNISWEPPLTPGPTPVTYNVYRNGQIVNPWPLNEWENYFTDTGLAPETPHVYWVEAVSQEGFASPPSNRVGAMTDFGAPIRVPEDFTTIQEAVNAATPGTTVLLAPGTYTEPVFINVPGITLRGQDANTVTFDLSYGSLDFSPGDEIHVSGITFRNGTLNAAPTITISRSIFQGSPAANIIGAGFVTNCIFEDTGSPSIELPYPEWRILVANSTFLTGWPFQVADEYEQLVLLNNAFPYWPDWQWVSQEINYGDTPSFEAPGPPDLYFLLPYLYPFYDGGFDVGFPFVDFAPDVGVFEFGEIYAPKPPGSLDAQWLNPNRVELTWAPAIDEFILGPSYEIYRSESPDFPGPDGDFPYATVPSFTYNLTDYGALPGTTYYYRVRAATTSQSAPSNTASVLAGGNAPTASNDSHSVDESTPLYIPPPGVLGNDSDPDGDPLTAFLQSGPSFADSFALHPDGSFDYTPLPGYYGTDSFTYVANDGVNDSNVATVDITVNFVNFPPDAVDDSYTLFLAAPNASLNVLLNDSDTDSDPLVISYVSPPDQGGTAINRGDHVDYSPPPGFTGVEIFSYDIDDGFGGIDTALVTVTVLNDPPVASDDSWSTDEDTLLSVPPPGVLGNDSDINGHALTAAIVTAPSFAQGFSLNPDGSFWYDPNPNFHGADSFVYRVTDSYGDSDTATVSITVNPAADTPAAGDDSYAVDEDGSLNIAAPGVLGNDSDGDGDPLTAVLGTDVSSGALTLNPDGSFTYTPDADFDTVDSFTYTAFDGVNSSAPATVTLTVNPSGDAPVLSPIGPQSMPEGDAVSIPLSAADPDTVDVLTLSAAGLPLFCTLTDNGDGSGTLDCAPGYEDDGLYTVTVTVTDSGIPALSDFEVVDVTVTPTNRAPQVTNPGNQSSTETDVVSLQIVATDPDGEALTYSASGLPSGLAIDAVSGVISGTLTYDSAGSHSVTVTASDASDSTDAVFTWTVANVNRPPVITDPGLLHYAELDSVSYQFIATDPDGDTLTYSINLFLPPDLTLDPVTGIMSGGLTYESAGSYGRLLTVSDGTVSTDQLIYLLVDNLNRPPEVTSPGDQNNAENDLVSLQIVAAELDNDTLFYSATGLPEGLAIGNLTGLISGTLTYDSAGTHGVTLSVWDGTDTVDTLFIWNVADTNRAPAADDQGVVSDEDTSVAITLTVSDADGDLLAYAVGTVPDNGTLSGTAPNLIYTPDPDFNGTDSFTFTADDGTDTSNTATVSITVNAVNDSPAVTNPGTQNSSEGDTVSLPVTATDVDGDTLSYSATGLPADLSIDQSSGLVSGTLTFDSAGSHAVTVTVSDGTAPTDVAFTWNVSDVPRMRVQSISTGTYVNRGKTYYTAQVLLLDDGGAPVSGAGVTGHWAGTGADSTPSTPATAGDGTVTFETNGIRKPSGDYIITIDDVVKSGYIYDVAGSVTSGQYPPPAQDPPVANGDSYSVGEGSGLNETAPGVLGNDTDAESDPLTAVLAGGPAHGILNLNPDGSFTYTHDGSETTSDSFTYRANDGTADSNTATVTITVNPVNDAPTAADDSASTQQDTPFVVDVLANDSDPDGGPLTVSAVGQGTNGTVVNNGTDVTYTPNTGYTGSDSFTYTVSDGNGGTDTATVHVTVFAQNDPPTAADDSATTSEDTLAGIDVLLNDSDPDSDILSISAVTQGANGTVTNYGNHLTYMPDPDYHGPDSFTYTADDGNGGTGTATVSVTVLSVNDIPVAVDDSASTVQDTSVVIDVLANDSDADGDTLTVVQIFLTPGNGSVVNNGTHVTYTPDPGYTGGDSFSYVVDDGSGWTDSATVSVTVTPSNYPPVADAGPDQSGARRQNLTFDGSGSTDDGTIVNWEWDFGDSKVGSGEVVVHKFTKSGTYTVTLTVTDDQGATDSDTATVTIN